MSQPVKVGVIGVGALGRHHARLYKECALAELVGIYDINTDRAMEVAREVDTDWYNSIDELSAAVDGLSVAVPTDLHHEHVMPLLKKGKHVLVEKPIAQTVTEAEELVHTAEGRNLILQVGHVERFNPVLDCLHEVPGEPRFIEAHRLAQYPPMRPGSLPRGTEVSVILDLMIHDIDVVLSLVQSEIERVDAVGVPVLSQTEDIANARLQFANGCVANLTASRVSQEQLRKIRLFKSTAYLSLDYQDHKGELATLGSTGIKRQAVPVRESNALKDELGDFCRCINVLQQNGTRSDPRVTGKQGLMALRVAEDIIRSARQAAGQCA